MKALLCAILTLCSIPLVALAEKQAQPEKKITPGGRLDAIITKNLKAQGLKPNPMSSDEIFVRRIHLDIIGRVPTKQETVKFLRDPAKNKRARLVDELLASEGYVHNFYNYWADLLLSLIHI